MNDFITIWGMTIITFFCGIYIGARRSPKDEITAIKQKIEIAIRKQDELPVGPIVRPTQEQLDMRQNPKAYAGIKEFGKLIRDKIIPFRD